MWSFEDRRRLALRLAAVMAIAGMAGGCFQPLYGEHSPTGGPGVREMMAAVDIEPIKTPSGQSLSRLAVEIQNELRFGLTAGGGSAAPTHRLTIKLSQTNPAIIVDRTTQRAEFSNYGLDANYSLVEIATNKRVVSADATTRVTYDVPGQEQRFASARGLRDAESRAAKVIADMIRARLASYFIAGT